MPESPAELEQRAERAVRRGELLSALQLFEELIAQVPDDERVRQRMESVRALLHAGAGRFVEALRCYERAVAESPENELLHERLEELRELAPPGDRADLGAAEQLPAQAAAHGPPRAASRSHKVAHASFAPLP